MTQQTWGAPPPQQFQQPGFPAQQGYAQPVQPGGYAQQQAPWGGQPQQQAPWGSQPQQQAPWGSQPQQQAPQQRVEIGDSFDDFFSGGGEKIPGFDFGATQNGGEKMIGAQIVGEIVEMAKMQQRDYSSGEPLWFDNGDPRMQVVITLQTELRGWAGVKPKLIPKDEATDQPKGPEHDDGRRRIYVKGDMVRAINAACAKSGGQKPRIGGKLAVVVKGFEPTNKGNPKTLYDAQYLPAPEKVATDSFFEQAAPQQQAFGGPVPGFQGQPNAQGQFPPAQPAQQVQQAPVVHQQQVPAPQGFDPSQQQAPQQQAPAYEVPQGQGYAPAGPVPGTNPATLGNAQPPAGPPEWAQAPQPQPVPAGPASLEAPPF